MAQAGASIEAFLKLDATNFKTGITEAKNAVKGLKEVLTTMVDGKQQGAFTKMVDSFEKFKSALLDLGSNITAVDNGLDILKRSIGSLDGPLTRLTEQTKGVANFKEFALALEHMATAAQRLGNVVKEGGAGITALTEVMEIWRAGVESAEAPVINLTTSIRNLGSVGRQSSTQLSESQQIMRNQFLLLENTLATTGVKSDEFRAITQRLRTELGLSGQKLVEVRNYLLQTGMSVDAYIQKTARIKEQMALMNAEFERSKRELLEFARVGVDAFHKIDAQSDAIKSQMASMNSEFERSKTELLNFANSGVEAFNRLGRSVRSFAESYRVLSLPNNFSNPLDSKDRLAYVTSQIERNSQAMRENGAEILRNMGYTGKLSVEEEKLAKSSNQASSSIQRQASASRSATASANAQTTATNRLSKAMTSLRMIGTMVASMMVWNFASSLINATRETVNAKSEMEGYFQMLHFNQNEINQFNKALDDTVSKFQRINKYALGETISSIGVEFNLSTKEMEKAMPVVSMITSEYLRAGRNVNEASLAVKDILQGEFQRLSRETGVKGDQLKEAGWSGDKKDVMGLLEALDKVGKSRNWDVFVTKANSLNDAVLILQNRFSEWTAEMVNVVQPSILFVFNSLMTVGGLFGSVMSGIWEWLHDDGFVNQAVRWTGIATAITGVVGALVSYRTGANLVQIAQMGLRGSIMATILGLKAEEVATYGTRNAILSKITSLKAEQVATLGVRKAIAVKVLGLNAELTVQKGIKGAIMASTFARELEEASLMGANAEEMKAIFLRQQEELQNMRTSSAIIAHVFSLNKQTLAKKGLIVALAERIAQSPLYIGSLKAEEVAELSTARAGMLLMGSLLPLIAVFIGLAVAVYSVVKPLQDASEQMKSFNNLVNDGENIIKQHKRAVDSYEKSQQSLNEELDKATQGSKEYLRIQDKLKTNKKDLETANKNYKNSIKAVEMANSRQAKFEEEATKIAIHRQTRLADAYIKAGLSSQEAYEMASSELRQAQDGAEQLRRTLQALKFESDKSSKRQEDTIAMLKGKGMSDDVIKKYGKNLSSASDHISKGLEKFMTSDDLMERVGGWFEMQQGRLEEWWTEFNAFWEVRDWDSMGKLIQDGLWNTIKTIGVDSLLVHLAESIGEKGVVGTIMEALFGEGDSDGTIDYINDWFVNCVELPMIHWLQWFISDPFAHFKQVTGDFWNAVAKFLFGEDAPPMEEIINGWFDDNIITPIDEWVQWFISDPVAHLGQIQMDFNNAISQLLFGTSDSETVKEQARIWVENNILKPLGDAIIDGLKNIPVIGAFISLFSLISDSNTGASQKGSQIGEWIGKALLDVIKRIPIVGGLLSLLSLIPTVNATANANGKQVGDNVDKGYFSGTSGMVDQAIAEFSRIAEGISKKAGELYASAQEVGSQILKGIKDALGMHSPSIISRELIPQEFGEYIPQAISDSEETVFGVAQSYARAMYDGMNSLDSDFTLGSVVDDYQDDAQVVADYSQLMGLETTTAFNDMVLSVNGITSQMQGNVVSSYSTMQTKQSQMLTQMKSSNTTAYNEMYVKSNQSLIQMRDSTSNVTHQMIDAWDVMKNSIIASARQISSDATTHFDQLSNTIGSFYRKIQNPSLWGSGSVNVQSRSPTGTSRRIGRAVFGHGAGGSGGSTYTGSRTMSIQSLKRKLCPNGDCGNLFDGYENSDIIDVFEFLANVQGEHGFGGWDFASPHFQYIKNRTNEWDMKSPVINLVGGIPTDTNFKVREFANGNTPKIGFDKFQSIAGAIFSRIPYKHYYDSSWKGSWLGALQAGACNCSDGADALIALARTFGFSGYKQWGTWSGEGHFWAVINGVPMDTTAWQGGYGWTSPKVSGYGARNLHSSDDNDKVRLNGDLNITINANGNDVEVDNISEESARQILEVLGVSLATGR